MSSSREASPDWLRDYQAPNQDFVTIPSDSDSSPAVSPIRSDRPSYEEPERYPKQEDAILLDSSQGTPVKAKKLKTVKTEGNPVVKGKKSKALKTEKDASVKEEAADEQTEEHAEEDPIGKTAGPPVSSRLPLLFPDKVQRLKALVECDGDSIDLSGDVGAVGRIVISKNAVGKDQMLLDLKGTIYKTTIVPSRTFCIVSVGQSEAKVEAIMNDFIQLEPQSNVFDAETMIEGTLDGFTFDSDDEGDKVPKSSQQNDQNNENGNQAATPKKGKRKAEKSSGAAQKKSKAAAKPAKKAARKPAAAKRAKKSKK